VVALVHHVATNWDQTAEQDENELLMSGEAAEGVEE
jgi:hypothetical protein